MSIPIAVMLLLVVPPAATQPSEPWRSLVPGLDLAVFDAPTPSDLGDSKIRVLRIDPARFELRLMNASAVGAGASLTAREWSRRNGLLAAINASMYQQDHRTSVSLMRTKEHVNNPRRSGKDKAFLAFDPLAPELAEARIIDLECDPVDELLPRYGTVVQSIRMVSCKGRNVWTRQPKKWSTAAIGTDDKGNVLFIHARSPFATHDLIEALLQLPLGLRRAMYVEGGPEAQLYVNAGTEEHEFVGSFETGFFQDDSNDRAWPVPNVVGVARRSARED